MTLSTPKAGGAHQRRWSRLLSLHRKGRTFLSSQSGMEMQAEAEERYNARPPLERNMTLEFTSSEKDPCDQ